MKDLKIRNLLAPIIIIGIAILLRLLPHPPNVASIAAMALFGGAYLDKRFALAIPLLALFASDIFIGFHSTMPFVYGSFVLTGIIGMWLRTRRNVKNIVFTTLGSSVLFFLITNFGVWFLGTLYPRTLDGLLQSYLMGLPFFRNTLIGDLVYAGMLFGGYEVINRSFKIYGLKIRISKSEIRNKSK